jgi:hypothetical protein
VFLSHEQHPVGNMTYVVRSTTDPASIVRSVKSAVWSVNKELPFRPISTLQDLVAASIAPRQFVLVLIGTFGIVGLLLAALGLFGLVNHLVVQRTREIGVRVALGAARTVLCVGSSLKGFASPAWVWRSASSAQSD